MQREISIVNRYPPPKSSIKREIFQSSALLALIVVAVFGFFLSTILYYSEISKARAIMNRTNHAVVLFIEGYFTEIINTITMLDENKEVRDAITLGKEARQRTLDEYLSISKVNKNITYIYSGYENGLMLINGYTPPAGFDPTTRPWYRAAMAIKPETSIGLPYQEIQTKEWLVSTSKALKQSGGGYSGVVTIDCSIEHIVHLIAQHDEYKTEFSFVMDRSGKIIMHPDQSMLGKSLQEMKEDFQQNIKGDFTFTNGNVGYFAHSRRITLIGWTVVTVVEKREILRPIISQVALLIGLTGVFAVFLGLVQSIVLSRRLSRPLVELGRKIKATIAGDQPDAREYIYPSNEIGTMAWEIGQLAEKELNAKTRELQTSEDKYRLLIEHAVSAVASHKIVRDEAGRPVDYVFLSANPAFETHTGLRVADILGHRFTEVMPGIERPPFIEIYNKVVLTGESVSFEQYSAPLGRYYFINAFRISEGCFATIFIDITDRKRAEDVVRESEETYKTILMASPDDITIADLSGRIIIVSDAAHKIFGYAQDEGPGMSVMDFIAPEDHERAHANIVRMLHENYPGPNEYRAIRKDKSCFDIEVNNALIRDRQGNPLRMVLIVRDITRRKKAEQQIQELVHQIETERDLAQRNSLTDSLTGLPNRRFFDIALKTEFSRHKRYGMRLSLIMLDVDHFKKYNDYYGHLKGDECLQQIARALKDTAERAPDIVARYGGEEFVVILPDTNSQGAAVLAGRIGESVLKLNLPHAASDTSKFVTISLGIASATDHVLTDGDQLVALADQALYHAKKNGRNRYEVLTASI
jgi:diguanylate cyclase (GGDEF)-like protein/PAS domain S-box-containing protein